MGNGTAEVTFGRIVGERIRALRTGLGWSQTDLARRAGRHVSHVAAIERGRGRMSVETLVDVAFALGVDPAEVVAGLLPRGRRRRHRAGRPARPGPSAPPAPPARTG